MGRIGTIREFGKLSNLFCEPDPVLLPPNLFGFSKNLVTIDQWHNSKPCTFGYKLIERANARRNSKKLLQHSLFSLGDAVIVSRSAGVAMYPAHLISEPARLVPVVLALIRAAAAAACEGGASYPDQRLYDGILAHYRRVHGDTSDDLKELSAIARTAAKELESPKPGANYFNPSEGYAFKALCLAVNWTHDPTRHRFSAGMSMYCASMACGRDSIASQHREEKQQQADLLHYFPPFHFAEA